MLAVGVDAGGTSTVAALSRDGVYRRSAIGGPANASALGSELAARTIVELVRGLLEGDALGALYVGAAGAGRRDVAATLETALRAAFPKTKHVIVEGDAESALRAALPTGPGAVLIAGTGSVAYARNGTLCAQVGGDGYLLGDEGSAFAVGLSAVRLLARSYQGRVRSDETTALVERALEVTDRDGLLALVYSAPLDVAKIAGLAPSVVAFAGKGNRASVAIVRTAAEELVELLRVALVEVGLIAERPAVALAGGLLRENSVLTSLLERRIGEVAPDATIVRLRDEPARAALSFAEAMLG